MFFSGEDLKSIKLIDLGSADDLVETSIRETFADDEPKRGRHKYFVGTSQYMAPECLRNRPTNKSSDIWCLGCILYQLYMGYPPFRGGSDYLIFQLSEEAKFMRLEELSEHIMPAEAKKLIRQMVAPEQAKRSTIEQVLQSDLFNSVRHLDNAPKLDEEHQLLRNICDDFVKRVNVYSYDGKEKYLQYFETEVVP